MGWLGIAVALAWGGLGCASKPKGASSKSLGAVVVYAVTPIQIQQATADVFQGELYTTLKSSPTQLVFEKPGSWMNQVAYSGWFGADVWARVKVNIRSYDTHSHLVECEVFMVRGHGDAFFEEEVRVLGLKRRPFQELMDKVKRRLN